MNTLEEKLTRVKKQNALRKFNNAMYVIIDNYVPTDAYCLRKMMFMKGGTTFNNFDHENTNHPLFPCVNCDDYFIDSKQECYRSSTLITLKNLGIIPNIHWRLTHDGQDNTYK